MDNTSPMFSESNRQQTVRAALLYILLAALVLTGGCYRKKAAKARQARLIAGENMELKRTLGDCEGEIIKLNRQHDQEILGLQNKLLACQRRSARLQEDIEKGIDKRADSVGETVMAENARLRAENARLQAEIKRLLEQN
jgi:hypothetical protein